MRAAASSIANGRPSRARHSRATAGAVSAVSANDGSAFGGALSEQRHGVRLGQWGELAHHLAVEPERPLARGEHPHAGRRVEHLRGQGCDRLRDVLAVVEDEQ